MSICLINGEFEEDQAVEKRWKERDGEENERYSRLSLKNH